MSTGAQSEPERARQISRIELDKNKTPITRERALQLTRALDDDSIIEVWQDAQAGRERSHDRDGPPTYAERFVAYTISLDGTKTQVKTERTIRSRVSGLNSILESTRLLGAATQLSYEVTAGGQVDEIVTKLDRYIDRRLKFDKELAVNEEWTIKTEEEVDKMPPIFLFSGNRPKESVALFLECKSTPQASKVLVLDGLSQNEFEAYASDDDLVAIGADEVDLSNGRVQLHFTSIKEACIYGISWGPFSR